MSHATEMNGKHTFQTVSDLVQENWESDLPDAVLEALRPLDGKNVTTRILDKLPGGRDKWILERAYGMTHLKNKVYAFSQGSERGGVSLILDWREDSFPLDIRKVEEKNPAYFSARKERNHKRMEARNTKELLDKMATAMNRVEAAKAEFEKAKAHLESLTEYGAPFEPDRYAIEGACGLRDEKGNRYGERNYGR